MTMIGDDSGSCGDIPDFHGAVPSFEGDAVPIYRPGHRTHALGSTVIDQQGLSCLAALANHHLQRDELLDQGHVPLRIMSIRATMDGTGRVVRLN